MLTLKLTHVTSWTYGVEGHITTAAETSIVQPRQALAPLSPLLRTVARVTLAQDQALARLRRRC